MGYELQSILIRQSGNYTRWMLVYMFSYTEQDVIIIEKAKKSPKRSDITIGVGMTHMGQTIHF